MWYGDGVIYFACTNGGPIKRGQIFCYRPSPHEGTTREKEEPGRLTLFVESKDESLLEFADNLTISPWGDLVVAEDGPKKQFIRGVTPQGKVYTLGANSWNNSEFTGPCFAPNHPTLFINIQRPGLTLAVTGPWSSDLSG